MRLSCVISVHYKWCVLFFEEKKQPGFPVVADLWSFGLVLDLKKFSPPLASKLLKIGGLVPKVAMGEGKKLKYDSETKKLCKQAITGSKDYKDKEEILGWVDEFSTKNHGGHKTTAFWQCLFLTLLSIKCLSLASTHHHCFGERPILHNFSNIQHHMLCLEHWTQPFFMFNDSTPPNGGNVTSVEVLLFEENPGSLHEVGQRW